MGGVQMELKDMVIGTLEREVVPAMGCTEPVAVSLGCAKAREAAAGKYGLKSLDIKVSANIYKNGMGVGVPGTNGEIGLAIAAALGVTGGHSEKGLNLLSDIDEEALAEAKKMVESGMVHIEESDVKDGVYVDSVLTYEKGFARSIIKSRHDRFIKVETDEGVIFEESSEPGVKKDTFDNGAIYEMTIKELIELIESMSLEDLAFMLDGIKMNKKISFTAMDNEIGMGIGYKYKKKLENGELSDDLLNRAMVYTASGADARMSGISMPVMSSSGSGNHGLTATLPLAAYASLNEVSDEKLCKALAISHMVTSYIKRYTGRLSALCGCGVAAGTAVSGALVWIMGGTQEQIEGAISNMIASISGMVCDGAKLGCALKLVTASSSAVYFANMAMDGIIVPQYNGLVGKTVEESIKSMGKLAADGMVITDKVILKRMVEMDLQRC